jgi:hypothetical protein
VLIGSTPVGYDFASRGVYVPRQTKVTLRYTLEGVGREPSDGNVLVPIRKTRAAWLVEAACPEAVFGIRR